MMVSVCVMNGVTKWSNSSKLSASIRTKLLQLAIYPAPNEAPALIGGKLPENCDAEAKI